MLGSWRGCRRLAPDRLLPGSPPPTRIASSELHARARGQMADDRCPLSALIEARGTGIVNVELEEERMATERRAEATWQGSLMEGSGRIENVTSGALGGLDVSWAARAEEPGGKTSPEELIAAAHATCFAMALSHGLAQEGHTAEQLQTSATVTFQPGEGITKIALSVEGRVPGMDDQQFRQAAEEAKENCPVSK